MTLNGTARIMGRGKIRIKCSFPLNSRDNSFSMSASFGPMPFTAFNAALEPALGVKMRKGQIRSFKISAEGNGQSSSGNAVLQYNDLKVAIVNKQMKPFKNTIANFYANNFLIISDNPKQGEDLRSSSFTFNRDPSKSFINYIWYTVFTGMLSNIGVDSTKVESIK
jgi:hypothetical protein